MTDVVVRVPAESVARAREARADVDDLRTTFGRGRLLGAAQRREARATDLLGLLTLMNGRCPR